MLGYHWEGPSTRIVWLTDILDVERPVLLDFCQTWEVRSAHSICDANLKDRLGIRRLTIVHAQETTGKAISRDFDLTTDDNEHIDPKRWNSVVRAGLRIADNVQAARQLIQLLLWVLKQYVNIVRPNSRFLGASFRK
ncbi:hypothetical protein C8J56DRAFT_1045260 [Mycena floridula]|nr:hypothetical protein C8J56DRAFT_1045260 [Mycena floridula]